MNAVEMLTKEERAARDVFEDLVDKAVFQICGLSGRYGSLRAYLKGEQRRYDDYLLPGRAVMKLKPEQREALVHFSSKLAAPITHAEANFVGRDEFQRFEMSTLVANAREKVRREIASKKRKIIKAAS